MSELWRHPVKSMQGEPVRRLVVTATGALGDRGWAVRDAASGAVLSAKREPRLLLAAAAVAGDAVLLTLPDGTDVAAHHADAALAAWLGRPVVLAVAETASYVDEAQLHLLTRAELGTWDVRRFRPNVVVDGVASLDELVGERIRLGDVVVEIDKRTKRCAMPTMPQPARVGPVLGKDVGILRTLARDRDLRLGVYARVITAGVLDLGAPVEVV